MHITSLLVVLDMSSKGKRREVSVDEALTIIGEFGLSQKLQILLVRIINLFNIDYCGTLEVVVWALVWHLAERNSRALCCWTVKRCR